jgi:hypothetical protein
LTHLGRIGQVSHQVVKTLHRLAVDVGREILAGGGELQTDCEAALLEDGSQQSQVWGADWYPPDREMLAWRHV